MKIGQKFAKLIFCFTIKVCTVKNIKIKIIENSFAFIKRVKKGLINQTRYYFKFYKSPRQYVL